MATVLDAMRPKPGVPIPNTIDRLRRHILDGNNNQSPDTFHRARLYLQWIHDGELLLRQCFEDVPLERLHTDRFWHIRVDGLSDLRAQELISDETAVQVAWLEKIEEVLITERRRHEGSVDAVIAVPDTNALLHYRLFDQVDWREIVSARPVRLSVPLRVVDELDEKKASRRTDLATRARTVIRHLRTHANSLSEPPALLGEGVTIEIAGVTSLDGDREDSGAPGDIGILDTCESVMCFSDVRVVLITGDYGMQLRASNRGVQVVAMPEELRLGLAESPDGS